MHTRMTKVMVLCLLTLTSGLFAFGVTAEPEGTAAEPASLYERLGAWDGISKVVADTLDLHINNPTISHYFKVDMRPCRTPCRAHFRHYLAFLNGITHFDNNLLTVAIASDITTTMIHFNKVTVT